MKKTLFLLCALLGTIGAWAETINLGNSASFKDNATFYKNGVVKGSGYWCNRAALGDVMLTGSISSSDGKIEVVKYGSTSLTISVPDEMTITGYSFGLQIAQNGSNTCTVNDTELNGSSATTVSASNLRTHSLTINFTGTGDNNGECRLEFSDFTVTYENTFSNGFQLSNTKAYTITSARGAWTLNTDGTLLSSTHTSGGSTVYDAADTSAEAKEFAIYKQGDFYYIYNLKAKKFVDYTGANSGAPLNACARLPFTLLRSNNSSYPYVIANCDNTYYANNNNSGGIAINTWKNLDDGNRLAIAEARNLTSEEITAINTALVATPIPNYHKAFTVTTNRGTWCANAAGTSLATTTTNSSPAADYDKFALMLIGNKYYLYNVGTKKFIKKDGSLDENGGDVIAVKYSGDASRPYMFYFPDGGIYFNMQGGGGSYAMNTYSTPDDGNKQSISQTDVVNVGEMLAQFEPFNDVPTGDYHITTTIGGTKYYVTSAGKLSTCVADGTTFAITKTTGGDFGSGIRIDSGSERFTNPTLSGSTANLSQDFYAHGTGDRENYERQVFFMNADGKFAIRSCNLTSGNSSWSDAGRTFWTYNVADATPCYSYDPAYVWELEAPGTSRNVTFNFYYGGSKVHEGTVEMEDGVPSIVPSSLKRDFCTYTYTPVTVSSSATSVDVTATWAGPFNLSADFASAHWYDMAVRGNWYVTSDNLDGDGALKTIEANALGLAEDAYQWAFVGDPWHVQLFNKDKGSSKVYVWTSTDNASIPDFVDASSSTNYWWIRKSTASGDAYANAFLLTIPEYGYQVNQFSGAGGPLKIWQSNGTHDAGSAFRVFDVPDDFHEYAVAEIQPYATATGYFAFTDAVKTSIGWQDSYATECPFQTYKSMKETLMAIDMTDMSNFNIPATGYYRFKSKTGQYMGFESAKIFANFATNTGASTIVHLTKNDDNGKFSIALQGRYLQLPTADSETVRLDETPAWFTATVSEVGYGVFSNTASEYGSLHYKSGYDNDNDYHTVVGWVANAEASKWVIEDAEDFDLTIGSAGYSTLWVPFAVEIPSGVTAYTGSISGDYLHLNEVTSTLPASTAVVLQGNPGNYTFNLTGDVAAIQNDLKGSNGNVTGGSTVYALAQQGDEVGFYPVGDGVTIPAGKAYLNVPAEVKGFTFVFDDDATGLDAVNGEGFMVNGPIYNLAGQRINKLQKGINIVNGKKVLF